ncbi:MAG: FAD synthetase family protein, partial [Flavobacterium sp.]
MNIFNSIADFSSSRKTVATIGTFDGVHVGHRKIIDRVVQAATDKGYESLILTFFPHPRMVLHGDNGIKLLNTIDEKKQLLEQTGLQNLIIHPFDEAFASLSAEDFVRSVLVDKLNIGKIIIGHDHRFGHNRDAGIEDLIR